MADLLVKKAPPKAMIAILAIVPAEVLVMCTPNAPYSFFARSGSKRMKKMSIRITNVTIELMHFANSLTDAIEATVAPAIHKKSAKRLVRLMVRSALSDHITVQANQRINTSNGHALRSR
jgi:hypothetical protein